MSTELKIAAGETGPNIGSAGDRYVAAILRKYAARTGAGSVAERAAKGIAPVVRGWAGRWLLGVGFSGSYAKGTAISLGTDVDLFISLRSGLGQSVKETYWSLFQWCADHQWSPQPGNVSVRVMSGGVRVDLVPGRRQTGASTDHSLYRRKADTWTQTNVEQHIKLVATSGRTNEIRAIKIWRELHHLDFPSFYLELSVIEALRRRRTNTLASNVWEAVRYLADGLSEARIVDPANSNNVVSDDLGAEEKGVIARAARKARMMRNWESVLW